MEPWQRIGVYAAGLALADAGIARKPSCSTAPTSSLPPAAASATPRSTARCSTSSSQSDDSTRCSPRRCCRARLRPTLFLAQLSNMLAGNISIVHDVTGSSRTFMGEEMAGLAAVENAVRRIAAGQADLVLVGGALNAEREDLLLGYELGHNLWRGPFARSGTAAQGAAASLRAALAPFSCWSRAPTPKPEGRRLMHGLPALQRTAASRAAGEVTSTLIQLFERLRTEIPKGVAAGPQRSQRRRASNKRRDGLFSTTCRRTVSSPLFAPMAACSAIPSRRTFPLVLRWPRSRQDMVRCPAHWTSPGLNAHSLEPSDRVLVTAAGHWRGEGLALVEAIA